jgi:tetratricopeptide (TPR) repeat protein
MQQTTSFDFAATLRAWADITRGVDIPMGTAVAELIQRAELISRRLNDEPIDSIAEELRTDSDAAELMHALLQLLEHAGESADEVPFIQVCRAYGLTLLLPWKDEIDEAAEIRGQLALIAWRHCRRFRTYREAKVWEARCVAQALSQGHVRDFLSIPSAERSDALLSRYFDDGVVVLALSRKFELERNRCFDWVASEAVNAFEAMRRLNLPTIEEERAFFMYSVALSASVAFRYLGSLRSAAHWISIAKEHLTRVVGQRPLYAIVDLIELVDQDDRHEPTVTFARAEGVRRELRDCGVDWHIAAASLLIAGVLKDSGRLREAAAEYRQVAESQEASQDPLLLGMALHNAAEAAAGLGGDIDVAGFRQAREAYERHGAMWPMAQLQASIGECLRDRGMLDNAIEAYRSSVRTYDELSMKGSAAYMRLLLAETLIARGKDREAVCEIARALEFADSEGRVADIKAGAALLVEVLRRGVENRESDALSHLRVIRQLKGPSKP